MSSANAFNLDKAKLLSSGKGLILQVKNESAKNFQPILKAPIKGILPSAFVLHAPFTFFPENFTGGHY